MEKSYDDIQQKLDELTKRHNLDEKALWEVQYRGLVQDARKENDPDREKEWMRRYENELRELKDQHKREVERELNLNITGTPSIEKTAEAKELKEEMLERSEELEREKEPEQELEVDPGHSAEIEQEKNRQQDIPEAQRSEAERRAAAERKLAEMQRKREERSRGGRD